MRLFDRQIIMGGKAEKADSCRKERDHKSPQDFQPNAQDSRGEESKQNSGVKGGASIQEEDGCKNGCRKGKRGDRKFSHNSLLISHRIRIEKLCGSCSVLVTIIR